MAFFTDQIGRQVEIAEKPRRIISLVPSQTELLYDLGLTDEVVGITKFCVHPQAWFHSKTRIGGTKQLNLEKIKNLKPDLIIANKEENLKEQVEELEKYFPVWTSDVNRLENAISMISAVGEIVGRNEQAMAIVNLIHRTYNQLHLPLSRRAAYFIWKDPYMTVGGDTFIHDMMRRAGFENIFYDHVRYPETTIQQLKQLGCETLLLSSEPFPFNQKHVDAIQPLLPQTKILLVDGEMFSWYGSRLVEAAKYFEQLSIHYAKIS